MTESKAKYLKANFWIENGIYVFIVLAVIALSLISDRFLKPSNLLNMLVQSSPLLILGLGMTFTVLTGGLDMSLGSNLFLSAGVGAVLMQSGWSFPMACLAMIVTGMTIGLVNGLSAAFLKVYPLLTTIATLYIARGIGLYITGGRYLYLHLQQDTLFNLLGQGKIFSIPSSIFFSFALVIISHFFLNKTPLGRHIYAVGNNPTIAEESGVNVFKVKTIAYVLAGLTAALAAILWLPQLLMVSPGLGKDLEFQAIIIVAIGGISLAGGRGGVFPFVITGTVVMALISNALVILRASPYLYSVIQGGIIFIAVFLDTIKQKQEVAVK